MSATIQGGDRSRSRSSAAVAPRAAARVVISPPTTGLASVASVQIDGNADGARADEAHLMPPDVRGVRGEVHAGRRRLQVAVRIGTATTHAMSRPVNIARPTDKPTRCPAPNSASDKAMS